MRRALVVDIQRTWDQNIVMQYSCSYFERRKVNPRFHLWVWPRHLSHSSPTLFYSSTFYASSRLWLISSWLPSIASKIIVLHCSVLHCILGWLSWQGPFIKPWMTCGILDFSRSLPFPSFVPFHWRSLHTFIPHSRNRCYVVYSESPLARTQEVSNCKPKWKRHTDPTAFTLSIVNIFAGMRMPVYRWYIKKKSSPACNGPSALHFNIQDTTCDIVKNHNSH